MRNLKQVWLCHNYFNFHVEGICSTTWSWKTMPKVLSFEGWTINRDRRSASKNRYKFILKRTQI